MKKTILSTRILIILLPLFLLLMITSCEENAGESKIATAEVYPKAMTSIQSALHNLYLLKLGQVGFMNADARNYYLLTFTADSLSKHEITSRIDSVLKSHEVPGGFEYAIVNKAGAEIHKTDGYTQEMTKNAQTTGLTIQNPEASHDEVLFLYLKE